MIKKFFEKDSVLKIVSFLAAILVWLYVIYIEDPEINITIDDIPIHYKTSELSNDLALVSYDVKTLDVKISANRSDIIDFEESDIEAYIDLAKISEAGKYSDVKINVVTNNKNVNIIDRSDKLCNVQIDDIITKTVPIGVDLVGEFPEGYTLASEPIVFIQSTNITGAESYIESVKQAFIKIDCSNLKESKTVSSDVYLLDNNDNIIDEEHPAYKFIKIKEAKSSAYVTVGKTKKVSVEVSDKDSKTRYSVTPSVLEIYSKDVSVGKIYTESVAGKKPDKNGNVRLKLIIPDGVMILSGETEVTVNIKND